MSIKVFTLWNLLPKSLDYQYDVVENLLDQYVLALTTEINSHSYFVSKSEYRGEAYLDESFEQFNNENIVNSDYLFILLTESQIDLLDRYVYARWFIFSMKVQSIRDKLVLIILGNAGVAEMKQNWSLICHRIIRVDGMDLGEWLNDSHWIHQLLHSGMVGSEASLKFDDPQLRENSLETSESTQMSNQITAIQLTNENASNEGSIKTNVDNNHSASSTDYSEPISDRVTPDLNSLSNRIEFENNDYHNNHSSSGVHQQQLKRHLSCPNLSTHDMCLNFDRAEKKGCFSRKLLCSIFFSLNNINDGSLYVDKRDRDLIFDRDFGSKTKGTKWKTKPIANLIFRQRKSNHNNNINTIHGVNPDNLEDSEISCEVTDKSNNRYNIIELNNDYILSESSSFNNKPYQTTFGITDDSCIVDSAQALELPPYTEPTDPTSLAYNFVQDLKGNHPHQSDRIDESETPLETLVGISYPLSYNNNPQKTVHIEGLMSKEDLDPITEITESLLNENNNNSDNTSRMAGEISISGSSTLSTSATSNPWGSSECYPEILVQKKVDTELSKSGVDSGFYFESPNSGQLISSLAETNDQEIMQLNQPPTPVYNPLSPTNLRVKPSSNFHNDGIGFSGAMSPNIMTRSVLLTGSSCESDCRAASRLRKRKKDPAQDAPQRKRSISPIYRDDDIRLSRRIQHQSRIDMPIRRRTCSTQNYKEYFPFSSSDSNDNQNIFESSRVIQRRQRPGQSFTQRQSRDPSLVVGIGEDEICYSAYDGELPSRDPSSERSTGGGGGQCIKSTQLPDGGWLTGVFSWFQGGSRAPTPIIGRREVYQEASTSQDFNSELGSESEFNEARAMIPTSASVCDFNNTQERESSRRHRLPSISHSDCNPNRAKSRLLETDFVISLINPTLRHAPRHVYWFYTSVAPTQNRLSQMMAEYRSNIPRVYEKVKTVISDNRTKFACMFIGTALFVPTAHHILPASAGGETNLDPSSLSFRFGNMINLIRPSLMWTGSTVISKFKNNLFTLRPGEK